jgi:hypothetical protein
MVTGLQAAAYVAEALSAVAAVALARRRPEHVPAAAALVLLCLFNLARIPLTVNAMLPPRAEPWEGAMRVLVYLDGAIVLGEAAIVPGLSLALAAEKPRRLLAAIVAIWLLASVALAALYPSPLVRGEGLRRVYLAVDLIGLFVAVVALAWARRRRLPGSSDMVAIGFIILDLALLLAPYSPWRGGFFSGHYDMPQVVILIFFAALAVLQVILWKSSQR